MPRLCLTLVVALSLPVLGRDIGRFVGKVVAIQYGDTITVLVDRQPYRIRLWGVDCPERRQAFGTRAR